jgi:hypothetical protein
MRSRSAVILAVALLFASGLVQAHSLIVHATSTNVSTVSISPTRTCCSVPDTPYTSGQFFRVNINASILSGQFVQGFDVRINYTNPSVVLQATGINYSNNIFASHQNSGPVVECIDGISQISNAAGCSGEIIGQVHFAESLLGPALPSPISGTLFTITFQVSGQGSSVFAFDRADVTNPNPDPNDPQLTHFTFIPVLEEAGVFGNQGVTAFFNYQPVDPSISVSLLNGPGNPVSFDASASFVASNSSMSFKLYSWNFGDGSQITNTTSPVLSHVFSRPGNYTVSLVVTDVKNETGVLARRVTVLPALGSLDLIVEDHSGNPQRGNVLVQLFNSSSSALFANKTVNGVGEVLFHLLTPGSYYLTFSGDGVVTMSIVEKVTPGWTTRDTVYVSLLAPPANYGGLIYAGSILTAVAIVGAFFVYQKRKASRAAKAHGRGRATGKMKSSEKKNR